MMYAICWCLFAVISSAFSFHEALPWNKDLITKLSSRRNEYGASAGFKPADIEDYPYLTSITFQTDFRLFPAGAGAILNKHWVLSSAYADQVPPEQLKIYIETNNAGRSGQRLNVTKILTHEKFNPDHQLAYNIAVIKTQKPITFSHRVKPVKLGNSVPKAGTDCTLVGYGYLQNIPYVGWNLGVATVEVKPQKECEKQHGTLNTAFCAEADDVVPCYGDIGDLLMYKNKLVGFYVIGDYCDQIHKAEVYTKVALMKKWIWKTIKQNSNDDEMEGLSEDQFFED